jgi:putative ABC transport system substrate-binding protein
MTSHLFLCALFLALIALPIATNAQETRAYRVALVFSTSPMSELTGADPAHPLAKAFVRGMRDLGYVEGQNLVLERRSAEGKFERFPEIFRELVTSKVDVIVTFSSPLARAAKDVTQTVPIVMGVSGNPVEEGLVQSLAHPGGNITGLTIDGGPEIAGKRLQLLKELLPRISRVAVLASRDELATEGSQGTETAASRLGLKLLVAKHTPTQYEDAFALIARERPGALLVAQSAPNYANRRQIVDFVARSRLSAMYPNREFVDIGGLISYGPEVAVLAGRAAQYVDRILKGENPANLPVERPTKFELVINLQTAKTLGLTVPASLRLQASQIVE